MSARLLQRIQDAIASSEYDVTVHAAEGIAEDGLDTFDGEAGILSGKINKVETDDPRGARYIIIGTALNQHRRVAVGGWVVSKRQESF